MDDAETNIDAKSVGAPSELCLSDSTIETKKTLSIVSKDSELA